MKATTVPAWRRSVETFPSLLHLAPPVVRPDDSLADIVAALSSDPGARQIFVTDGQDHLVGAIPEQRLDADLVKLVLPQPLWATLGELDTRELLLAAKGKRQTARDLMSPCAKMELQDQLGNAVISMIRASQNVIALVDEQHRLLGYLGLFEILTELLRQSDS